MTIAHRRNRRARHSRTLAAVAALAAAAAGIAVAASGDGSDSGTAVSATPTGELNAMGMPVIETPGEAAGTASAGAVQVDGADWQLGTVPLDTAVRPTWTLHNIGDQPVTIGEPHPEIRDGCCPGPFGLSSRTIAPGGETTLGFELSMHPGMDGWHDIIVHVPVIDGSRQQTLTLTVTGDFRSS